MMLIKGEEVIKHPFISFREMIIEVDRVNSFISDMDEADFSIIFNTDLVYRAWFQNYHKRRFSDILKVSVETQKVNYSWYLRMVLLDQQQNN